MIGYWQSMEGEQVLNEVNDESRKNSLPDLILAGNWNLGAVSRLEHVFERPIEVSSFRLHHLWIDLRAGTARSLNSSSSNRWWPIFPCGLSTASISVTAGRPWAVGGVEGGQVGGERG